MRDEEIFEDSCTRMRAKDSVKEGEIRMIRGVRATLAEMVACGGGPISHKLRNGGMEDQRRSQMTEGTGRLGDGNEGDSERED